MSKYVAGRDKDYCFIHAAIAAGYLRKETLRERLASLEIPPEAARRIEERIERDFGKGEGCGAP